MPKTPNGIIGFFSYSLEDKQQNNFDLHHARKVFDLKITNTFPLVTLNSEGEQFVQNSSGGIGKSSIEFQHFSIPPDLEVHLSGPAGHQFFETDLVDPKTKEMKRDFIHMFSWLSKPIVHYQYFPKGTWYGAALITLIPGQEHTQNTGLFVDFFVHRKLTDYSQAKTFQLQNPTCYFMRPSEEKSYLFGPYDFYGDDVFRGKNPSVKGANFFTIRFGFYECRDGNSKLVIPFKPR